jgi:CRP-like cAMP-binding protein
MNALPVEEHLGKTLHEVLGIVAERIRPAFEEVFQTGVSISNFEVVGKLNSRQEPSRWIEYYFPIKDRFGKVKEIGAMAVEVSTPSFMDAHLGRMGTGAQRSALSQVREDGIVSPNPLPTNIFPELFSDLTKTSLYKLLKLARRCSKQPRDTFCRQGEQAHHVYLLLKGLVKVGGITQAGKEVLLDWMQPGESFGLGAVLSPPPENLWTVSSVANTEAFEWDMATISRFAESCPAFHRNALRIALRWAQQLQKRFESLSTKTVEQRVADSVVFLAERFRSQDPAELNLSDEELGQMTGTNLFTVNKILRGWQRLGHVNKSRKRLIILDCESLRRISGSSVER